MDWGIQSAVSAIQSTAALPKPSGGGPTAMARASTSTWNDGLGGSSVTTLVDNQQYYADWTTGWAATSDAVIFTSTATGGGVAPNQLRLAAGCYIVVAETDWPTVAYTTSTAGGRDSLIGRAAADFSGYDADWATQVMGPVVGVGAGWEGGANQCVTNLMNVTAANVAATENCLHVLAKSVGSSSNLTPVAAYVRVFRLGDPI